MANHNSFNSFNSEPNEDDDSEPSPIAPIKPISFGSENGGFMNFMRAAEESKKDTSAEEEADSDEEAPAARRGRASRSVKDVVFKRHQPVVAERPDTHAPEAAAPDANNESLPETPAEADLEKNPEDTVVEESPSEHQIETAPESADPITVEATPDESTEEQPKTSSKPVSIGAVMAAAATAQAAKARANANANTPPTPPAPPTPPHTPNPNPNTTPPNNPNGGGGGNTGNPNVPNNPNGPPNIPANPNAAPLANPNVVNNTNIIDRRRTGVNPALALLAYGYLRHKDRQNKRALKNTNQRLKETNQQVQETQDALAKSRKKSTEQQRQIDQLKYQTPPPVVNMSKTAEQPVVAPAPQPKDVANASPVAEQLPTPIIVPQNETILNQRQESPKIPDAPIYVPTRNLEKPRQEEADRAVERRAAQKTEVIRQEAQQPEVPSSYRQEQEKQASNPESVETVYKESDFDRRHEVKDDPAQAKKMEVREANRTQITSVAANSTSAYQTSTSVSQGTSVSSPSTNGASYKQSMQTGFMVGLAVVVLGAVAFFITRL